MGGGISTLAEVARQRSENLGKKLNLSKVVASGTAGALAGAVTGALVGSGAGVSAGRAESSDFIVAPAYNADVDVGFVSGSLSSNDAVVSDDGLNRPGDNNFRQQSVGVGVGAGGSQVKTAGTKGRVIPIPALQNRRNNR